MDITCVQNFSQGLSPHTFYKIMGESWILFTYDDVRRLNLEKIPNETLSLLFFLFVFLAFLSHMTLLCTRHFDYKGDLRIKICFYRTKTSASPSQIKGHCIFLNIALKYFHQTKPEY